ALLPSKDLDDVKKIQITQIVPNPYQPRKNFDEDALNELASSIKEHGLLQPILLRKVDDKFEIIAGERRWRAANIAGLHQIPALIRDFDDKLMSQLALVENLQREDLNPLEEAEAYQNLIDEFEMTQEMIALSVGKSRTAIANTLRLLKLSDYVKENVSRETISGGHARALLPLADGNVQNQICDRVIAEGWSVRRTEDFVRELIESTPKAKKRTEKINIFLRDISERIGEHLGTRVRIKPGKKVNKIEIEFYDDEDLQRILNSIGVEEK
ncbi:MAG: ParB/RepB/Spo0J family partition protein, partial [Firmicutes bacterium]|nr:ParB/RepB/Spo0J family partition protein [Bacillota bacterium]